MASTDTDRISQFKSDIADMKLKTGAGNKENLLQVAGAVLMVAGIALAFIAYMACRNVTPNVARQAPLVDGNTYLALAITGLAVAVSGAAMFLRYSLAKFMRIWLLRQMYESQAHIDQVVAAVRER